MIFCTTGKLKKLLGGHYTIFFLRNTDALDRSITDASETTKLEFPANTKFEGTSREGLSSYAKDILVETQKASEGTGYDMRVSRNW